MKTNYILSAAALFLLAVFLGVWLCSILLGQSLEPEWSDPPMKVEVSVPAEPEPLPAVEPEPSSASETAAGLGSDAEPVIEEEPQPDIRFELSNDKVYPGDYIVIRAYNAEADEIKTVSPFTREPMFFETGDHLSALFPIKYIFEPGEYTVSIAAGDVSEEFTIELLTKDWQTQHLTVASSTTAATIDNSAANEEYNVKAHTKKQLFESAPLWDGNFIQPVEGRITTEFGMQRTVNGVPGDRHGGVDIAAARGTPVAAANSGKVIFAEFIALTGNTVCIEHGMGLKTWYYHMDSLSVSAGEMVEKGQQIGTIGSTGFSTGPHLHWAAAVFDVYIDPWLLTESAPAI
ncbi:MAG: peptidoglycan DD-metalloendopeptidase family protein [Oscillospiraceae bacterium]|nr:peptidoglycan DD-metalloendopeptidase family protein [Oscillospiraceae bacterium]